MRFVPLRLAVMQMTVIARVVGVCFPTVCVVVIAAVGCMPLRDVAFAIIAAGGCTPLPGVAVLVIADRGFVPVPTVAVAVVAAVGFALIPTVVLPLQGALTAASGTRKLSSGTIIGAALTALHCGTEGPGLVAANLRGSEQQQQGTGMLSTLDSNVRGCTQG